MEANISNAAPLDIFVQCLKNVSDPRSKQGGAIRFNLRLQQLILAKQGVENTERQR